MKNLRLGIMSCIAVVALAGVVVSAGRAQPQGGKHELPPAVARTVEENKPGAKIEKLEIDTQDGIRLYDIEFAGEDGEIEVAEDGTVLDVVTIVHMKDVPTLAAEAIQKAAVGAQILRLERSEIRSEIKVVEGKGQLVKLPKPRYVYEAELAKGKQTGEVTVGEDGTMIEFKWD